MRNEILIAFWITLLAMVVFGCLQEEAPASDILEDQNLSQDETATETINETADDTADVAEADVPGEGEDKVIEI